MTKQKAGVKRLFADIEVSPNVVLCWKPGYKVVIGHDSVIHERKIICIGYKWEWEKKVHVIKWDENQNDEDLLRKFSEIANEADEIVGHFGDSFDWPWIRGRMVILGLPPLPMDKTIDTKAWASKMFLFNSNKLDYLSRVFGYGGKLHTDYGLWKKILLDGSRTALAYMAKYCGVDVIKLEKVFHRIQPWMEAKTHAGVFTGHDRWSCALCGSENVIKSKTKVSPKGTITHQMKCKSLKCSHYYTINDAAFKRYNARPAK